MQKVEVIRTPKGVWYTCTIEIQGELDRMAETKLLTDMELLQRRESKLKIIELEKIKKMDLQQKAKIKWTIDGDENSRFFHGTLKNKNRKKRIHGLMIDGVWSSNPSAIKNEVQNFFEAKFHEKWPMRPKMVSPMFKRISTNQQQSLESSITMEEIKNAVWCCGGGKAPGPDGFTFKLLKDKWDIIKSDVAKFVQHFETYGKFAHGSNSSFITLIPKIKDPLTLGDYRPISLIGGLYKMVAKILASRLKAVVSSVVDEVQSAYIEGRNILDGPLVMNEIYSWAKKIKKKMFLFKVDFEKAFDSINWNYLDSVMEQMGFGCKWRNWILGCLKSSRAFVIINGSPTDEFSFSKGVRQGDPLSPFLFIIAMEGLNVAIKNACNKSLFHGIKLPNKGPLISHLFYADDAIFVGEWNRASIRNLSRILKCFQVSSGLKVNFHKSRLFGISTSNSENQDMERVLGCMNGSFPFIYLGVPVGANMKLKKHWKLVIEKLHSKLSTWKAKSLSFGGRLTPIKSVLSSLPTYYFSLFKAPIGIIKELEKIRRKFLWGGDDTKSKIH